MREPSKRPVKKKPAIDYMKHHPDLGFLDFPDKPSKPAVPLKEFSARYEKVFTSRDYHEINVLNAAKGWVRYVIKDVLGHLNRFVRGKSKFNVESKEYKDELALELEYLPRQLRAIFHNTQTLLLAEEARRKGISVAELKIRKLPKEEREKLKSEGQARAMKRSNRAKKGWETRAKKGTKKFLKTVQESTLKRVKS